MQSMVSNFHRGMRQSLTDVGWPHKRRQGLLPVSIWELDQAFASCCLSIKIARALLSLYSFRTHQARLQDTSSALLNCGAFRSSLGIGLQRIKQFLLSTFMVAYVARIMYGRRVPHRRNMVVSYHAFLVIVTYEISRYAIDTCDVPGQRVVVLITGLGLAELTYTCAAGLASTSLR